MIIRSAAKLLLAICLLTLCGCFVRSIHPTYLESSVITDFDKYRQWQPLSKEWVEIDEPRWERRDKMVVIYQDGKETDRLDVVFFKVGNGIYLDAVTEFANSGDATLTHTIKTHCLYRVTRKGDMFQAAPLSQEWLEKLLEDPNVKLPYIVMKDSYSKDILVNATPQEWKKFLETYGDDPEAFEYDEAFHFLGIVDGKAAQPKKDAAQQK